MALLILLVDDFLTDQSDQWDAFKLLSTINVFSSFLHDPDFSLSKPAIMMREAQRCCLNQLEVGSGYLYYYNYLITLLNTAEYMISYIGKTKAWKALERLCTVLTIAKKDPLRMPFILWLQTGKHTIYYIITKKEIDRNQSTSQTMEQTDSAQV